MRFTDKYIQSLKPKLKMYDAREGTGQGFGIRIMPSGYKSWIYIYYFEGKKKRHTLGPYPQISLAEARSLHRTAQATLASGKNPAQEQLIAKTEAKLALNVSELVKEYIEKWAKPRKRSWKEDLRLLTKDAIPIIGKRKAKSIQRRDIILLLDTIVDRGSPIAANRTLAVLRRMFNFALERDIVDVSPCYLIKPPSKENRRDRMLNEDEIRHFWRGLDKAHMSELTKLALKLQLVTAQRKAEIISAEWNEFNLKLQTWEIPGIKTKNGIPHTVPLTPLTIQLLEELKALSEKTSWLFPAPKANTHMAGQSIDHALRRNIDLLCLGSTFTPHDLRRTAASHMTSIGIPRLVVSKILNHADNSITAIYDRHLYRNEQIEALNSWSKFLSSILTQ